jgi:hypothetical protein
MSPGIDLSCELEKLPNLFEHYAKHKTAGNESVLEFLAEHFVSDHSDHQEKTDPDHKNLPFHGFHQCCHAPVFCTQDENFTAAMMQESQVVNAAFVNSLHSSAILESPFQPPQA